MYESSNRSLPATTPTHAKFRDMYFVRKRKAVNNNIIYNNIILKLKIKIYRTIILPVVLYGCETWSLTVREELG